MVDICIDNAVLLADDVCCTRNRMGRGAADVDGWSGTERQAAEGEWR